MPLFETTLDLLGIFLVVILGAGVCFALARSFNLTASRALVLYAWHTLFSIIYALYVANFGGDMLGYYRAAQDGFVEFDVGTRGIEFITMILYEFIALSFLGMGLFFGIFGTIGLMAFDASMRHVTRFSSNNIKRLATLIVFLPSVSFWSAGMGKDALSFMAVGLALWASMHLGRRMLLMVVAIAVMLLVRPHIAGLMVMGVAVAFIFDKKSAVWQKLILGVVAIGAAGSMVPFAMQYSGLAEGANSSDVMDYIEGRQGYNTEGGGGVDIANMSLPMQMFTYLFRPFPFEAHSIPALAASVDNMILLYLFVAGIMAMLKGVRWHPDLNRYFILAYSTGTLLILSMTTANLGIAMRQKWMFVPLLIVLLISFLGRSKGSKNRQIKPSLVRESREQTPVKRGYRPHADESPEQMPVKRSYRSREES